MSFELKISSTGSGSRGYKRDSNLTPIARILRCLKDPGPALKRAAPLVHKNIMDRFARQEDPEGIPWKPWGHGHKHYWTREGERVAFPTDVCPVKMPWGVWRRKQNSTILNLTGRMKKGIKVSAWGRFMLITAPAPAAIHEFGANGLECFARLRGGGLRDEGTRDVPRRAFLTTKGNRLGQKDYEVIEQSVSDYVFHGGLN